MRRVNNASSSGGTVTVSTSDASLTDVLDRGAIYSSFHLFDVASQASPIPASSGKMATAKSLISDDGSQSSSVEWKNRLLSAEQTTYAYNEKELVVIPQGKSSMIMLTEPKGVEQSFTATVTAEFEPEMTTTAEWGGTIIKKLDSAQVAAKGTLSLTALAQYDFAAAGAVEKNFRLFKRTWRSLYTAGPVPVYQKIILTMDVNTSASASAKIKAMAQAQLAETVEVGARYDGSTWAPYITHGESDSLTASLDIVGGANAEIRLIPKIEVIFYKVASGSLTVEPFANSDLTFAQTTNNVAFLTAHPNRLIQLTSFDAALGMESNVAVTFKALGHKWDALPSTCVLGTGGCLNNFSPVDLFSIPQLTLTTTSSSETQTDLQLQITDGTFNPINNGSIEWEVFPKDATLTPGPCSKAGTITTCTATFTPGAGAEYTVFASGADNLDEVGRQYKEITLSGGTCSSGPQTVNYAGHEWQRCDDGNWYNWNQANAYCANLVLDGHSDWRLPTKDELKSLVVCSNGTPTPLQDYPSHPYNCEDGNETGYRSPTIDTQFSCQLDGYYWSSSVSGEDYAWLVHFGAGYAGWSERLFGYQVRCVR